MKEDIKYIWTDLQGELFKFILSRVKNEEVAKDILQEVFIKIHTNIETLKDITKFTSWTYQITRNTIVDYFRKYRKEYIGTEELEIPEEDSDSFDYSKLSECINQKIKSLTEKYQEAIVLTYLKNYSQKELANHLNISYSGTKSRVQKARDILKEKMLDCPNLETDASGTVLDFTKE